MKCISTSWLAAIHRKPFSTEGKTDMKEKHLSKACSYKHQSKTCTSNICGFSLFQHRQFLCNNFFLSGLTAATVCREAYIGKQSLCCHCTSDFLSFAVCPPDVPILVEVEVILNKAGIALPAIFCGKQLG